MHRHHANLTPLDVAREKLLSAAPTLDGVETIDVADALGRVAAEALYARESVPHYHAAAMDGIAVRAADTASARDDLPVALEHGTPSTCARPFSWVDTGNALPAWADAVIMIERVWDGAVDGPSASTVLDAGSSSRFAAGSPTATSAAVAGAGADPGGDDCCAPTDDAASHAHGGTDAAPDARPAVVGVSRVVHVRAPATPWQHVRLVGEDVVAGDLVLARGRTIRPYDVGALLAAGITRIAVRPRPVVAILPTGDELIEPDEPRRPGRIVEFNSRMLAAFVREWGGEPVRLAPVGDNVDAVRSRLTLAAREADVVCVIAGSSAGEHDFTAAALSSLGTIVAQGVAVMPGKPAIVATLPARDLDGAPHRARVALGIPGYPVSAAVICRELLAPLLAHLVGRVADEPETVRAITPHRLPSRRGQQELVRVVVADVAGRRVVCPLPRGAGAISTLARAGGIVRIPADAVEIAAGTEAEVELLRSRADVRGTILIAGSHDPALALLEDVLRATSPVHALALSPVGGDAGLAAVARGEAHAAAVFGPDLAAVGERARDAGDVVVLPLARRTIGLVVAAGNPLGLRTLDDLARPGVRTPPEVERSALRLTSRTLSSRDEGGRGAANGGASVAPADARAPHHPSGARASDTATVAQQELSPLAVAAAVQSGLADAGIATAAAAAALGADLVPLGAEVYALVLRADFAASDAGRALASAAASAAFTRALATLPGYEPALRADADAGSATVAPHA